VPASTLSTHNSGTSRKHSQLAIGAFSALFLIALIASYLVYQRLVESEERRVEVALNAGADVNASAISAWAKERLSDAEVFSGGRFLGDAMHSWLAQGAPDNEVKQQILDQLKAIKSTFGYLDVCVYDINGRMRLSTEEGDESTFDLGEKQTAMRAFASNRTEVSSIRQAIERQAAKRVVYFAAPLLSLREEPGKIPTAMVMTASADMLLNAFIQSTPIVTANTEAFLVEVLGDQVVVSTSSADATQFGDLNVLPIGAEEFMKAAATPQRSFVVRSRFGNAMVSVARKIEGMPWYLVTMVDMNAAHANLNQLAWLVTAIAAGLLLLLGAAVLFWWRQRESQFQFQSLQAATERALLRRQYDFLSKYANDLIVLTDANGAIVEANDKAIQTLGRSRAELIGTCFWSLSPASISRQPEEVRENLRTQGSAVFEADTPAVNGNMRHIEVSARAIDQEGQHFIQMIGRDITERRQSEEALRESKDRINSILASIVDVVWSLFPDLARFHYINQSVERIYGYPVSAFLENPHLWFDAIHPEDKEKTHALFACLTPERPTCDTEYRIIRRDQEIRWIHCKGTLVVNERGQPVRIDGVATDVTERKNTEQQVQQLAYYDSVTDLPNRRLLQDRLEQAMHMAMRSEKKVALFYMDLDNFKNINDSLGHHIGDMLLREIADRLMQCVREEDTVARVGGDEFQIVLPDLERGEQAVTVADKILAATSRQIVLQEHQIHTTISIGISIYPEDAQERTLLMQHADSALYQAKNQGRDNYQFFTKELNQQIMRNSSIERQLRNAMTDGQLHVWYQPQIDISSGKLIGAEALLRCVNGNGEFLSPVEFIPVAEERGMIGRIGEWVMREACMQCRQWQRQGLIAVPIAVNVSPLQFQQKGFAGLVTDILSDAELDPTFLELEITESSIMRRAPQVAKLAMRLREAGVGISIDDFGTGYSSLSYLKQIPIDKIKIDRSFINDMLVDDDDDAITYAIINLAHSLNLRVIAEGVESDAQIDRLRMYGCDEVQGHIYSTAVSPQAFEALLANGTMFAPPAALRH
jgi:diguanylate cyclase (GGDEF)-like protein/PAS domain S-box-containing protein